MPLPQPFLSELSEDELIRITYAVTLEPERYGELIKAWSRNLEHFENAENADGVNRHFDRALTIMERLGRGATSPQAPQDLVDGQDRASMVVSATGEILAANAALINFFGQRPGLLDDLELTGNNRTELQNLLANLEIHREGATAMVLRIYHENGIDALIMAVTATTLPSGTLAALITSPDVATREQVGDLVGETFGLTKSEIAIAQNVVDGLSAHEIAERRSRALETIRTQIKSVLQKLELRSQTELIRVFAGFSELVDARREKMQLDDPGLRKPLFVTRDAGRQLAYECFGPSTGRVVLFLHGMLDGLPIGPRITRELMQRNIRLVGIWRPSFHMSEPDGAITGAPERFVEDIRAVMDVLGVQSAPILGHLGGSIYAFAAAALLAERISGLVIVGGAVPLNDPAIIRRQPTRQRIIGLTAKYFPASLPLLLRAGIGDFDADGGKRFIGDLYNKLPFDRPVLEADGNFALYRDELEKGLSQGFRGFQIDAATVVRDWSPWVEATHVPVDLIHGAHDQVVQIEAVRAFAEGLAGGTLTEIEDLGQLVLYARPEVVFEAVERRLR